MKCPVCGTNYSADPCPICGYEDFFIVGSNEEESRREVQQRIRQRKTEFYGKIRVGIVLYHYEVSETAVSEYEERVLFPLRTAADGKIYWLPRKFESCSARDYVETDLYVEISGEQREFLHHVAIRNIPEEGMQEVGLQIDENLHFVLKIRSDAGKQMESQPQYLFAG